MFAGLPGIGVGTLFYVLTGLFMPIRELGRLLRGDVSAARWRLVVVQFCFSLSIIASVALADRVFAIVLTDGSVANVNPARIVNETFAAQAPQSIWAAPVMASFVLLLGVLLVMEVLRAVSVLLRRPDVPPAPGATETA